MLLLCTKCELLVSESGFHKNGSALHSWCKRCKNKQTKRWAKENRRRKNKTDKLWKQRNRVKDHAHAALRRAVKNGILLRPQRCQWCLYFYDKIEAHHVDYAQPLRVLWLCKTCHALCHMKEKAVGTEKEIATFISNTKQVLDNH